MKDSPSTTPPPTKKHKQTPPANPNQLAGNTITRGASREQLSARRKSAKSHLSTLSPHQRSSVLARYHGTSGRTDLSTHRLRNLRRDDDNEDTSKLSSLQLRNLQKRRGRSNPGLKRQTLRRETKRLENAMDALHAEEILQTQRGGMIEVENDMERTTQVTQEKLKNGMLEENVARNVYDLELGEYSPYRMNYDRSGRYSVLCGRRGHVAVIDQHTMGLRTEFHLGETARDACFLHNGMMMAVAQEKNVFIYDENGVEIHRLDAHKRVFGMEFLPYHWLLATIGHGGFLQYQDTSTGLLVSQHRTKLGPCHVIRQNPFNAVLHLGHTNGTVTLWSPSSSEYLVKMLCHKGSAVTSVAIDRSGTYMATGGGDSKVRIWDLRMYKETHSYTTYGGPPMCLDISQTGILGVGHGCHSTFWKAEALKVKVGEMYMRHESSGNGPMESLRFRPFEDVCGIGHAGGISSIVIPGSGEPCLDSMEHFTNPYMDSKQRREAEVRSLLEKLSPDMIALDPDTIGSIEESNIIQRQQRLRNMAEEADARKAAEKEEAKNKKEKKRMRGRSKIAKKLARKQKNVIDENVNKLREAREREKAKKARQERGENAGDDVDDAPAALKRFF
ncbi:hypothetical protein HJC23_005145 [Cyclotella cryptica]|uniref:BING4 C-terminal domain-containing protein n=1 Tax=Cyclotella cryptica TaxID=29204 RepID=A0ABD3QGQ7_9STRA|eukprot:CCRYP_005839-RB/>CCRYP_005839-RB protein AED:0.21 eAED:0.21 QI:218/1/1/1/0.4/0.33/6/1102/615